MTINDLDLGLQGTKVTRYETRSNDYPFEMRKKLDHD